jgi:hypothetical protein
MTSRIARRPALVAGLTMFVVVWTLTTHGKYSADGDEPHYLMVTRVSGPTTTSISPTTTARTTAGCSATISSKAGAHARLIAGSGCAI